MKDWRSWEYWRYTWHFVSAIVGASTLTGIIINVVPKFTSDWSTIAVVTTLAGALIASALVGLGIFWAGPENTSIFLLIVVVVGAVIFAIVALLQLGGVLFFNESLMN